MENKEERQWTNYPNEYAEKVVEVDKLKKHISELERVLRMVEWVLVEDEYTCPWCHALWFLTKTDNQHKPDCPRRVVLGE